MRLVINPKFPFTRRMGIPLLSLAFSIWPTRANICAQIKCSTMLYMVYGGAKWNDKFHELNGLYPLHSFEYFSYSLSIFPPILSHLRSATGTRWLARNSPVRIFMALHPELLQHPTSTFTRLSFSIVAHCVYVTCGGPAVAATLLSLSSTGAAIRLG